VRRVIGGLLFGAFILIAHEISGMRHRSGAVHPCAERSCGVLLMTARSSAATIKAIDEQGGAP
jgi:hypothetical protein